LPAPPSNIGRGLVPIRVRPIYIYIYTPCALPLFRSCAHDRDREYRRGAWNVDGATSGDAFPLGFETEF